MIVALNLFGQNGIHLIYIMNAFIMMIVGVFQIFSISSILTYDIYATYLRVRDHRVCFVYLTAYNAPKS